MLNDKQIEDRGKVQFQSRKDLATTVESYRILVEGIKDYAIFMLNPQGYVTTWNVGAERIKGYHADEIIGQHFSRFYTPEAIQAGNPEKELQIAAETGRYEEEGWRVRWDGSRFWANVIINSLRDDQGQLIGFVKVTQNLTERKQLEQTLKESEERYRLLIEGAKDFAIFLLAPDGQIISWNPGAERIYGYPENEILGQHFSKLFIREDILQGKPEEELKVATSLGRFDGEGLRQRKEGSRFWATVITTALFNENGDLLGFSKITKDITDRKRVENSLLESEARLRAVVDTAIDAIITIDPEARIVFFNKAAEMLFGYSNDEVIGENVNILMPSPYHEEHDGYLENYLHTGIKKIIGSGREVTAKRKDGSTFPIELSVSEVQLGERRLFTGIIRNIMERKQAETALIDSESRMRAILDTTVDAIITIDEQACILSFNQAATQLFGYRLADVFEQNVKMLMPSPYREEHDVYIANYIQTGVKKIIGSGREVVAQRKDGSTFPIELSLSEVQLKDKRIFTGIIRDITERKQTETALINSGSQIRAILDTTVDAIITIDEQACILSFNQAATKLFGYTPHDVLEQNVKILMPNPYQEEHDTYIENYLMTGVKKIIGIGREVLARRKDGTTFPIELSVSEVALKDRRIFTGIIRDITERKKAEEELRLLQTIALSVSEAETLDDALAVVLKKVCQTTGWALGDAWISNSTNTKLEASRAWFSQQSEMDSFRRANEGLSFSLGMGLPGRVWEAKEPVWIQDVSQDDNFLRKEIAQEQGIKAAVGLPVLENGQVIAVIEFFIQNCQEVDQRLVKLVLSVAEQLGSVLQRKKAEAELRALYGELEVRVTDRTEQLQALNKELEAFTYSVSHDLRAPLRSIDGFSQLVLETEASKLSVKGQDYLGRVRTSSQQMAQLIDDLLKLSRLTRAEPKKALLNLSQLARELTSQLQEQESERQAEVHIDDPLIAYADSTLIRAVLQNLLGNAWKFTKERSIARIEFGKKEQDGRVIFFVRDNGAGFDMRYAGKLFGAFQRLHDVTEFPGTGIGLASVQRIIHRHGGEIWAEATVNQGATFYFTL